MSIINNKGRLITSRRLLDVQCSWIIRNAGFASRVIIYLARYSCAANKKGHEELSPELRGPLVSYGGNTMIANCKMLTKIVPQTTLLLI